MLQPNETASDLFQPSLSFSDTSILKHNNHLAVYGVLNVLARTSPTYLMLNGLFC
jgi:hypothetical protein